MEETAQIFEVTGIKNRSSLTLMDEFESRNADGIKKYDTLLLVNLFSIFYRKHCYQVSFFIQRMPRETKHIPNSLTFTGMKKSMAGLFYDIKDRKKSIVINEVFNGIYKIKYPNDQKVDIDYFFELPVKFNAQNSSNRRDYRKEYYNGSLLFEGNSYGETTDYMFVGAKYRKLF